ncbi:MAG: hypothetical protein KIS81_07115 [Maricaulaceae bacterium]|nr:hypothetical protein [Maricaulaceae bacterium]
MRRSFAVFGFVLAVAAGPAAAQERAMFQDVTVAAAENGEGFVSFSRLSPDVMMMEPGEQVSLNALGLVAELDRITPYEMGARAWVGRIEGGGLESRVILTESNGFTFGSISTPDGVWNIVPTPDGRHRIFQHPAGAVEGPFGESLIPPADLVAQYERENRVPFANAAPPIESDHIGVGSLGTIDIMVVYTQSMVDLWGPAVSSRVQYLMAVLDQALIDSDTGLRARLVHLDQVAASETASNSSTLADLQAGAGTGAAGPNGQDFSALLAIRNAKGADLVAMLRHFRSPSHVSCGIAYLLGGAAGGNVGNRTITTGSAPLGVSVNSDWIDVNWSGSGGYSFCSDATFAHEVGHNMGSAHNYADANSEGVLTYSYGWRVDGVFRTIMAYPSGSGEPRVNYFSNPDVMACPPGSASCGSTVPDGSGRTADVARSMREQGLNVQHFRAEAPRVVSSVLPLTRSVMTNTDATAFVTVINPAAGGNTATGCGLRIAGAGAGFNYQTTNPDTNAVTGTANTPVDIPSGGSQSFVISMNSASVFTNDSQHQVPTVFDERNLFVEAFCGNRRSAEYTFGVNSFTFSASASAVPDVIALAATLAANPGFVVVPTDGNMVGVFSVAVTNIGAPAMITAAPSVLAQGLAIQDLEICQTDPNTGACTTARLSSVAVALGTNDTATFGVFVRGNGGAIPNLPASNRVFVRFFEGSTERGATSVAVRTP